MSFPTGKKPVTSEKPAFQAEAPSAHMSALLSILEETDRAVTPLTSIGMDGRTAAILREIEKSGAISVEVDEDNIWVDVMDRDKALSVIDALIARVRK